MKIEKITYRKQVRWITTGTAESWTEPAFMKFVRSTIETLPHGFTDELLKIAPIKSINSKKFEINLRKGRNLLT